MTRVQISTTLALIFVTLIFAFPGMAQQFYGVPGSPSSTEFLNSKVLPAPAPKFGGAINRNSAQSKPW